MQQQTKKHKTKITLICSNCGDSFLRPKRNVMKNTKYVFCSRDCMKIPDDVKWENEVRTRREYYIRNKDKINEKRKIQYNENKNKILAKRREYVAKNKEKVEQQKRDWYIKHGSSFNQKRREQRKDNLEYTRKKENEYRTKNSDRRSTTSALWRLRNPEKVKAKIARRWANKRHSVMFSQTKKSAKNKGISFDLTKEWVKIRLDRGVCELSGIGFDMEGKRTPNSPSIDRIEAKGDYTQENCRVVLFSVNMALRDWGENYIIDVFKKIINKKINQAV